MTKEQEAQQAQTFKEIKDRIGALFVEYERAGYLDDEECDGLFNADIPCILEIVDSQAQKISDQKAELNVTTTMLNDMNELCTEQAKEIERLTTMCKQEDAQIITLVKERDSAREFADEWRDKAGSKYDPFPWEK